jgi:spore germination cell wall hydrolase CwlJ-like protein
MSSSTKAMIFALMVYIPAITFADSKQETCLAKTVYYECRGCKNENEKLDIAKLVINRTKHKKFPKTICSVISQKDQFKWFTNSLPINDKSSWENSKHIARAVMNNPKISRLSNNVLFFKLKSSNVRLANNIKRVKFNDKREHSFFELIENS